jgi:hypothetical protein
MRAGGGGPSIGLTGAQMAGIGPAIQAAADRGTIANSAPYYSRVFFDAARVGAGPFTYTVNAGTERRVFGYAKGGNVQGTRDGVTLEATAADTNLVQQGQTLAGQTVLIQGVSCMVQPGSDFELARRLLSEISVNISTNGDTQALFMGTPLNLPGIGGLFGLGSTALLEPALNGGAPTQFAKLGANGQPLSDNFRRVPEGLIWRPAGAADSNLVIKLRTERAVVVPAVATRVAGAGILAYDPPAFVSVDLMFQLICVALSEASVNF